LERKIKLKIEIDPSVREPEVIIRANEETSFIKEMIDSIRQYTIEQKKLPIETYQGNIKVLIDQADIIRVYTEDRKLTAWTMRGVYQIRCSLRELAEKLDADWFVRISRFEIINLNRVSRFDFSIKDTMKVVFEDGNYSWVSRRFINPVQQRLSDLAQRGGKGYE
jgi:DNA-binding LytR/AlgR family response regulator